MTGDKADADNGGHVSDNTIDLPSLADGVLTQMVDSYERNPVNQFTITPSLNSSGAHRVAHPGGRLNALPELVENLMQRKMIAIRREGNGFIVVGITIRGFDYHAYHLRDQVTGW